MSKWSPRQKDGKLKQEFKRFLLIDKETGEVVDDQPLFKIKDDWQERLFGEYPQGPVFKVLFRNLTFAEFGCYVGPHYICSKFLPEKCRPLGDCEEWKITKAHIATVDAIRKTENWSKSNTFSSKEHEQEIGVYHCVLNGIRVVDGFSDIEAIEAAETLYSLRFRLAVLFPETFHYLSELDLGLIGKNDRVKVENFLRDYLEFEQAIEILGDRQ